MYYIGKRNKKNNNDHKHTGRVNRNSDEKKMRNNDNDDNDKKSTRNDDVNWFKSNVRRSCMKSGNNAKWRSDKNQKEREKNNNGCKSFINSNDSPKNNENETVKEERTKEQKFDAITNDNESKKRSRTPRKRLKKRKKRNNPSKCPTITELQSAILNGQYDHLRGKAASHILNELFPPPHSLVFTVESQSRTVNQMHYVISCRIGSVHFEGAGASKKEARTDCCQKVVDTLFSFLAINASHKVEKEDFEKRAESKENEESCRKTTTIASSKQDKNAFDFNEWLVQEGKNPVSVLIELHPDVSFTFEALVKPSMGFVAKATVMTKDSNEQWAEATASSKRLAKLEVSKVLLLKLHRIQSHPWTGHVTRSSLKGARDQSFADTIKACVTNKFELIMNMSTYAKSRILAGIVMTSNIGSNEARHEVICFATGTKCISGEHLCLDGTALNDCHAEIVAKRAFLIFLYDELHKCHRGLGEQSVLVRKGPKFSVREGISFHLFISGPPCGDARVYSHSGRNIRRSNVKNGHRNNADNNSKKSSSNAVSRGLEGVLRYKVESGIGTVPLTTLVKERNQTWDGVMSGDRLLTMSCSDKMLKWNVVGIQGALLSNLLHPIYVESVVIGSKFHPGKSKKYHTKRALYGRIEDFLKIQGIDIKRPRLLCPTKNEGRQFSNYRSNFSVNWVRNNDSAEVVCGSNGRRIDGNDSRLCKRKMFERYLQALNWFRSSLSPLELSYSGCKTTSKTFQARKQGFEKALSNAHLGTWVHKPVEQDQFCLQ